MAPPTIQTSILQFSSREPEAALQPREEVVIDGESSDTDSDDDNDVMVITPQSRKRKRLSAIVDEDDDEGDDGGRDTGNANRAVVVAATAARRHADERKQDNDATADDDDDDDVEIVQVGATATPLDGSASKKSRRLTVEDSDDDELQHVRATLPTRTTPSHRRHSTGGMLLHTPSAATPSSNASSSRRSSRIERKRQVKESEQSSVRKLEYLNLDNCLDDLAPPQKRAGGDTVSDDDDDFDDDEDVDGDVGKRHSARGLSRSKPHPQRPRESEREGRHADGGEDLDEFIVGDNEVEYMDDDDDGVISVGSSNDDIDGEDEDEDEDVCSDPLAAHRVLQQTREPLEWFGLYLEYLEESVLDAALDDKIRRRPNKLQYMLYREATRHIERALCSRRDTLRGSIAWPDEMVDALRRACYFKSSRCGAERECEACKRQNHIATYRAQLSGVACDATELYRENWMARLRKSLLQAKPVNAAFEMGSVCHARTLAYWQLLHAKRFWCILVDAKRRTSSDATGRINEQARNAFVKQEFGRYKRLLHLVDTFETEARQSHTHMSNVWKRVTPKHCVSELLPSRKRLQAVAATRETRRGTIDSFVAESEEEDDDEDNENEDENSDTDYSDAGDDDYVPPEPRESKREAKPAHAAPPQSAPATAAAVGTSTTEVEDMLCLVCGEHPRNGGIVHGQYLHFYCCFRCGKRQLRAGMGCLVCDRPIDRVLRLLPLTPETRRAIQQQSQT